MALNFQAPALTVGNKTAKPLNNAFNNNSMLTMNIFGHKSYLTPGL